MELRDICSATRHNERLLESSSIEAVRYSLMGKT